MRIGDQLLRGAALIALVAIHSVARAQSSVSLAPGDTVTGQRVTSTFSPDGTRPVIEFRNVRYAGSPGGDARWTPPADFIPATGHPRQDAADKRVACWSPSLAASYDSATGKAAGFYDVTEDCLMANIWAPDPGTGKVNSNLPVMVWIHGGSLMNGSGSMPTYNGTNLAAHGNVIVVTINYRLGVLGYLALPELSDEQSGRSGNYGLMDQVAALTWIKKNIASFGGDPANVTVFGESAGGQSVNALLARSATATDALFKRAIVESGHIAGTPWLTYDLTDAPSAESTGRTFVAGLPRNKALILCGKDIDVGGSNGSTDLGKLRQVDAGCLVRPDVPSGCAADDEAGDDSPGDTGPVGFRARLTAGGPVLDRQLVDLIGKLKDKADAPKVMIGFNASEMWILGGGQKWGYETPFLQMPVGDDYADKIHQLYDTVDGETTDTSLAKLFLKTYPAGAVTNPAADGKLVSLASNQNASRDSLFGWATLRVAEALGSKAYTYFFDHNDGVGDRSFINQDPVAGDTRCYRTSWSLDTHAKHGAEINYVFGNEAAIRYKSSKPGENVKLSSTIMDYWTRFAWSGNPNKLRPNEAGATNALAVWKSYEPASNTPSSTHGNYMHFGDDPALTLSDQWIDPQHPKARTWYDLMDDIYRRDRTAGMLWSTGQVGIDK